MPVKIKRNPKALEQLQSKLAEYMHTKGQEIEQLAKSAVQDDETLHDSITTETEQTQTSIETRVGTNLEEGVKRELGTSETPARPWLRPAFNAVVKKKS